MSFDRLFDDQICLLQLLFELFCTKYTIISIDVGDEIGCAIGAGKKFKFKITTVIHHQAVSGTTMMLGFAVSLMLTQWLIVYFRELIDVNGLRYMGIML